MALEALYMYDMQTDPDPDTVRRFWMERETAGDVLKWARQIVGGVRENIDEIDGRLKASSRNWRIERMSRVDRNVLRIAVYELIYNRETPGQIVINEAIEIARRYGDNQSPAFVNGILDHILKEESTSEN